MPRVIPGLVYTNDQCIGCNRCVSVCPIAAANVAVMRKGMLRVEVDGRACIRCGRCITACRHGAREYLDDTDRFFDDLAAGEPIDLIISPTFFALYPDEAPRILGYLKTLGVGHFYHADLGAVIAAWCYLGYLDEIGPAQSAGTEPLAHVCPAFTKYIEHQSPDVLARLAPIHTPHMCMAVYLHEYMHVSAKLALLSPCIAAKGEVDSPRTGEIISYSLTYHHLMEHIDRHDLGNRKAICETLPLDTTAIIPPTERLMGNLEWVLPPESMILEIAGLSAAVSNVPATIDNLNSHGVTPVLAELYSCDYACIAGPGAENPRSNPALALMEHCQTRRNIEESCGDAGMSREERRRKLDELFAGLDPLLFRREYEERFRQPSIIPESIIDEVFGSMRKNTAATRHIDCGNCGHATCREMVEAIANGHDRRENCSHYTKDETIRRYRVDFLTGICNEVTFHAETRMLIDAHPDTAYIVGVVDVKDFKVINDQLGFDEGNRTLRYIANLLAAFIGNTGTCCRLHTDYFAFCTPDENDLVNRLLDTSRWNCEEFDLDFPLTLKFGFYRITDRELAVNRMVDFALMAHSTTRDNVLKRFAFYNDEMREAVVKEATIVAEMHGALADGQFHVYYQPQYNHATCSLVGAEALVRWIHPEKGMVSPADFIPVFEKNGFITHLDHFVWERTCAQLREWIDEGLDVVPISVNLSRLDIYDPDLVGVLTRLIEGYRIPQDLLKLEITESAYVESPEQLIETVGELQRLGFIIEMDDFGSGYSSLNTLKDVPVDILKIDLAFLSGDNSGRGGNILQSVIRMARWLELPVIAEGVESIQQADYLKSIGCEIVQGFYYSPPIPRKNFEEMLRGIPKSKASDAGSVRTAVDLDEIWNHESQLAWFFDHVLDSAIIFEYHEGAIEALRVNDTFYDTVGLDIGRFAQLPSDLMMNVVPEDRGRLKSSLNKALSTDKMVVTRERWFIDTSIDEPVPFELQLRVHLIALTSDRSAFCATVERL